MDDYTQRLLDELRHKDSILESIKAELSRTGCDLELMTYSGAIKKLISDKKELEEKVRILEKESDKIRKK